MPTNLPVPHGLQPPVAKRVPHELTAHGQTRTDEYFWLRDRDDPDTIAYLEAENAYTEAAMEPVKPVQDALYDEILARIKETDLSVPERRGQYFYYSRTEQGKQYGILCRKQGSVEGPEEILLDGNVLGEGQPYFRIGAARISSNDRLLAYSTDIEGDEVYTLVVKDLATGELLSDTIPNTTYAVEWAADNRTLFYTTQDEAKRSYRLYRHVLGRSAEQDELLYEEPDERYHVMLGKTRSREFLFMSMSSFTSTEAHWLRADNPKGTFTLLYARQPDVEYAVEHHSGSFYIRTNEQAKNFRLVKAPVADPRRENWQEVIPHRPEVFFEDVDAFAKHLVLTERVEGLTRLQVMELASGDMKPVAFPEPVYVVALGGNPEFDTQVVRFEYTSLVTPQSVFDYDLQSEKRTLLKQYEVLGGYDPERYQSERQWAVAADGTRIPLSIVYRRGMEKDGANPCFLYGYGSYGASMDPYFSSTRLTLLDRGFIYVMAHIRGGSELGKQWHDDGKLLKKMNTFTDFISSAEFLIAQGYTQPEKLVISGGSAGGLLMGAVLNLRPDLFGAVVANVPFVDVLNTAQDPTLPLTVGEYEEWGNSTERQDIFEYIRSYSPYDNVRAQSYPTMLVTAGLNDPRVSYWEPAKWVAKLRATKTDGHTLLLKTIMGAGHFGASGRYERLKETAFEYAFILRAMGNE